MTSRREILILACGGFAPATQAQRDPDSDTKRIAALKEAIGKVTAGATVKLGRVRLDVPPLIDNGNAVPVSVTVDSPMTPSDYVKAIHVFAAKNPQPYVLSAYLGPHAGRATVATRARIADSGSILAVAQMSDGSFWSDSVDVVVTLAACLEEGLI